MNKKQFEYLSKKELLEELYKYKNRSSNKERILFNISMILNDLKNNINTVICPESYLETIIDTIDSVLDYEA